MLKGVRVLSQRGVKGKGDEKLMMGDLVYDEKNNENGILLAVKPPIEIGGRMKDFVAKNQCSLIFLSKHFRRPTCVPL